jgi:uncharacterized protein YgbK (DUF1537 family)
MTTKVKLGCIADDFTGATDLANNLVRSGMRVVQTVGVPAQNLQVQADAVVVSLKSRTVDPALAIDQALAALRWLQTQGVSQIYFKYCSTFDSTAQGNIGPVTEALMRALNTDFTVATPAFPDAGRKVFKGHLFVGDVLLSESGMQDHPLTPMTDPNLVRVLQAQTQSKVGLIDYSVLAKGLGAIQDRITELKAQGVKIAIVDAISNEDLFRLGPVLAGMPLVTAGSGVAISLGANFGIEPNEGAAKLAPASGLKAIVSGSCSRATNAQVAAFIKLGLPHLAINPLELVDAQRGDSSSFDSLSSRASTENVQRVNTAKMVAHALAWAQQYLQVGPVLIYSTAPAEQLKLVQQQLGVQQAGALVEQTLARIAVGLGKLGVRQLIVAGGETSGAVVQALQIDQLQIGEQIDPGVPWCAGFSHVLDASTHIALKSGNFGATEFFTQAFDRIA